MPDSYTTIDGKVEDILLKEKGSRFIGFLYPTVSETDVKNILTEIRSTHPKATHHCYAYRLGPHGKNYRANDDGEPSGTAGLPIYNQLLSADLQNVLLIVVRYYGGTKLGAAGLIRAYKECAKETIEAATKITKEPESEMRLMFPFSQQNKVFTIISRFSGRVVNFSPGEPCTIIFNLPASEEKGISELLSEMPGINIY